MSGGQIMVIMIILIVSVASIFKARFQSANGGTRESRRSRGHRLTGGNDQFSGSEHSPRELELENEVLALRKRLEVLERITTDANSTERLHSQQVAAEIESLRDR